MLLKKQLFSHGRYKIMLKATMKKVRCLILKNNEKQKRRKKFWRKQILCEYSRTSWSCIFLYWQEHTFQATTKHEVIIMELCSAGSLFTMLDDPENLYGLDENEFKRVLKHISE